MNPNKPDAAAEELNPVQWMDKAIKSLYLEVDASIANDVLRRWKAAKEFLQSYRSGKERAALEEIKLEINDNGNWSDGGFQATELLMSIIEQALSGKQEDDKQTKNTEP